MLLSDDLPAVADTIIAGPYTQLEDNVLPAAVEQETPYFGKAAGHVAGTVPAEPAGTRVAALARLVAGEQETQCSDTVAGPAVDTCSAALAGPAGTRAAARTAPVAELAVGTAGPGAGIAAAAAAGTAVGLLQCRLPSSWGWR